MVTSEQRVEEGYTIGLSGRTKRPCQSALIIRLILPATTTRSKVRTPAQRCHVLVPPSGQHSGVWGPHS